MVLLFPWDRNRALELALLKTFCLPSIAGLLHQTGEFEQCPRKRYDATALMLFVPWPAPWHPSLRSIICSLLTRNAQQSQLATSSGLAGEGHARGTSLPRLRPWHHSSFQDSPTLTVFLRETHTQRRETVQPGTARPAISAATAEQRLPSCGRRQGRVTPRPTTTAKLLIETSAQQASF